MNDFDQAERRVIKLDPTGFLRWLIPHLTLAFAGWLDTRTLPLPGDPDRTCDTVAELVAPDARWALVIEVQTRRDRHILDRLLEYLARLRRELRYGPRQRGQYRVAAAVVNLTGRPQAGHLTMSLPGSGVRGLDFEPVVRSVRTEDAQATLEAMAAGQVTRAILPWVPLMAGGGQSDTMERWKEVAGGEPDDQRRSTYGVLALLFAELTGQAGAWRRALEGWDVQRSQIAEEFRAEGRAQGRAEGLAEGRAEGLAEGQAKGEIEAKREALLCLLQLRFQAKLPKKLVRAIQAQADRKELTRWFELAATAASLDDFRAAAGL